MGRISDLSTTDVQAIHKYSGHDEANQNPTNISPFQKKHDRKFLRVCRLSKKRLPWNPSLRKCSIAQVNDFRSGGKLFEKTRARYIEQDETVSKYYKKQPLEWPVKKGAMVDLTRSYLRVFAGRKEIIQGGDRSWYLIFRKIDRTEPSGKIFKVKSLWTSSLNRKKQHLPDSGAMKV